MKFVRLYTKDNKSYFQELKIDYEIQSPLGRYSKQYAISSLEFREFEKGYKYGWHNAPQAQYIIYLEGEVEVEASGGEKLVFHPGDVLLAEDITGAGHITRTLTPGRSIIVKT